jgi:hypothetical protein
MSTRRQDRTIVGVLEVSCSSRCFFGFVRKPSAFVMSFDCLLLSDVVRSFVRSVACLLSSVYKDRKVLALSHSLSVVVDNQLSSLLSTGYEPFALPLRRYSSRPLILLFHHSTLSHHLRSDCSSLPNCSHLRSDCTSLFQSHHLRSDCPSILNRSHLRSDCTSSRHASILNRFTAELLNDDF